MSMFCYQCQETVRNTGCTMAGVCGKKADTSNLQDVLIHSLRGIALFAHKLPDDHPEFLNSGRFIIRHLFTTITNVNFNDEDIFAHITNALAQRSRVAAMTDGPIFSHSAATFTAPTIAAALELAPQVGIQAIENEDVRSLRYLLIYGLKGISAYAEHAMVLDFEDAEIYRFIMDALISTLKDISVDEMIAYVMQAGENAVKVMALLDKANTGRYGKPEMTTVRTGVGDKPGILISGHDLKDLHELLEQSAGQGVDIYTHSEMLPAHYYPFFKQYPHLKGNYGGSWWHQDKEFATFNGPVLLTTNCLVPVKDAYKDRLFTTGVVSWPGCPHVADRVTGGHKDFGPLIELAKKCPPPQEIDNTTIMGGFGHDQILALADKVVGAVQAGKIKRFVVMAGCDGRHKEREYFTQVAEQLPHDAVILTAGCAKYRYNKLNLGDIDGIPRVLDAGQCNNSYSLAVIALKLKDVFGLDDINKLPLSFDIAWYEQKAVAVLLALLYLGFKGLRLGPTLPAFLSPGVAKVLVDKFNIKPITSAHDDVAAMMSGQ